MPRRTTSFDDYTALHALLSAAFAPMKARIDPPSSLATVTPHSLAAMATSHEIWLIESQSTAIACMILTPRPDTLYLDKLATHPAHRASGLAHRLFTHAIHCASCRRNCAAPVTAYFGVSRGHWHWTGSPPTAYSSTPYVTRHFCANAARRWPINPPAFPTNSTFTPPP